MTEPPTGPTPTGPTTGPIMSGPFARAAFDMTLDERVDVTCRHADLLPSVRRQRFVGLALLALVAGALTFGATRLLSPDGSPTIQAVATLVVIAIFACFGPRLWRRTRERATRRVLAEVTGDGPVPFVVELYAARIGITSGDSQASVPWHEVTAVRDRSGDVELTGPATLIVVRSRAFASPADAAEFRDVADRLRAAVKG